MVRVKLVCCKCGYQMEDICGGYVFKCRTDDITVAVTEAEEPEATPTETPK